MASRCGAKQGRSQISVTSQCATLAPAPMRQFGRMAREEAVRRRAAPLRIGGREVFRRCNRPRRWRRGWRRSANAIPASASEWPSRHVVMRDLFHAAEGRHESPDAKRCASKPMPVRYSVVVPSRRSAVAKSSRRGDLHVGVFARNADDLQACELGHGHVVGEPAMGEVAMRFDDFLEWESLRRLRAHQPVTRDRAPCPSVFAFQRIGHRQHWDRRVGVGKSLRSRGR